MMVPLFHAQYCGQVKWDAAARGARPTFTLGGLYTRTDRTKGMTQHQKINNEVAEARAR